MRWLRPLPGTDLGYDWAHIGEDPAIQQFYLDLGNVNLDDMDERELHLVALDIELGLIIPTYKAHLWN